MKSTAEKYSLNSGKKDLYSDFMVNIDTHPGKKDLLRSTNEKAIKRSVLNLLKTDFYERLYQPTLGANLKYLLFENANEDTLALIRDQIKYCIQVFEPRVDIIQINVIYTPDEHGVQVNLVLSIKNLSTPVTLDLILDRVR